MMEGVWTVARREIEEKLQDRGFIIFTVFMLLLVAAGAAVGVLMSEPRAQEYTVGVAGEGSEKLGANISEQARSFSAEVGVERFESAQAAQQAVREGDLDGAVIGQGAGKLLAEGEPAPNLAALLQSSAQITAAENALRAEGVDVSTSETAAEPAPLSVTDVSADEEGAGPGAAVAVGGIGILCFTVFLYGAWIANGVVEEKSSRVVEVVLSSIKPSHLLAGKILGIGVLGLGQLTLLAGLGYVAALVAGLELSAPVFGAVGMTLLWFIMGFVFYSCMFAIAGSIVSRHEDLQYTQLPIMGIIFACYAVAFSQMGDPGSLLARVLSFFPPLAPMLMPLRAGFGQVAVVEVVVAALIMIASTVGLVALAGRLYSGSILSFGSRVKLREAWGASR